MKHLLLTTIAAVVLVGCGTSIYKAAKEGQIEEVKKLWPSLGNSIRMIGDQFNLRRPKSVALRSTRTSHHANPLSHPRFPPPRHSSPSRPPRSRTSSSSLPTTSATAIWVATAIRMRKHPCSISSRRKAPVSRRPTSPALPVALAARER